jgi:hypothetical protein
MLDTNHLVMLKKNQVQNYEKLSDCANKFNEYIGAFRKIG